MSAVFSFGGTEFWPLSIEEKRTNPNSVLPQGWPTCLQVPLGMRNPRDLNLFTDGVLAESGTYQISLRAISKDEICRITFCVNDHNELPTQASVETGSDGSVFTFTFSPDQVPKRLRTDSMHPFSKTVGFARVEVNVEFADGSELNLYSMDIAALSATVNDNFENAKVLQTLLRPDCNQAAEWMFSQPGDVAPDGGALAADNDTDWANGSLDACSKCIDNAIALVGKGLTDLNDGFPNQLPASNQGPASFDTAQNQAIRAFIESIRGKSVTLHKDLLCAERHTSEQLALIDSLVALGNPRFLGEAKLPARELFQARYDQIRNREELVGRLAGSCDDLLGTFDKCAPGVTRHEFSLPLALETLGSVSSYQPFYDAMLAWRRFMDYRYTRESRALHVAKPDRLYEYYCLYRLLDWLYQAGFTGRTWASNPIEFFEYSIEETCDLYENEKRCANTYRLARSAPGGAVEEVDLYYVPVIYGDRREENGISLHKLTEIGQSYSAVCAANSIWTPDFLLVARHVGSEPHTLIVDSKYLKLEDARDTERFGSSTLFERIASRYLDRIGGGSELMPLPCQVWLLCAFGKGGLSFKEDTGGLLKLGTNTPTAALDALFACVDLTRNPAPSQTLE
ncbi:MAG: hypothetical protein ACI4B6_07450 [Atopobiaceae bacterium]